MQDNAFKIIYTDGIKPIVLRLTRLSGGYSKELLTKIWEMFILLCRILPGADIMFLAIGLFFFRSPLEFLLGNLSFTIFGTIFFLTYDMYYRFLFVLGLVIYLTRRYYLMRKTA